MRALKNLSRDKLASLSLLLIASIVILGLFAPIFAPHDPNYVDMKLRYAGSSRAYWFGNDHLGRCILSRLIYGIRPSILWVLAALLASVGVGAAVGFVAGYFRGKTDAILMRICDIMLSFPGYVMTLAVVGILGAGLENILIAFVAMKWAWFARVIRTSVQQYAEMDYVKFSKAAGISNRRIIMKHIVSVTFSDIAVIASGSMCSMILQISGLSFLGLGIKAPHAEWGMMLNEAREVMFSHPELMLAPGLAIVIAVSAFNFLADGLQVALDPKRMNSGKQPRIAEVEKPNVEYARG
ncbi:nickel/cobalt ABC transporter permease [Paenibacillus sp. FSL H8-0457]|uniref:staphylopine uptake ABC transporter permease subunit CntC n=1 Tax=unclassified Paenibacillus TaxID=185978 RepID=UPI0003E276FF|nr:nickel/cobalt ABC transporter permease [Paenibacillus sp. FSL H8-457]ETT62218.1 binding-protein-dependent transport systems inner membrane component [Paenibacillus sp. FSL H8-457]